MSWSHWNSKPALAYWAPLKNGVVIKNDSNQYPAPEIAGIRDRMLDIRGVDIRITFRSKNPFFTRERQAPREVIGFTPNRSSSNEDQYLRDSVIVTINTRNIGQAFQ